MAFGVGTARLLLLLTGDSAGAVRAVSAVNAALNETEISAGKANGALNVLSGAATAVGALGVAFVAVSGLSTKMAGDFQASMELVHTQAGASQAEVDSLKQKVLGLATVVGIGPDELAKGLYHVESAGFRGAQAMDILTGAAKLAQVGGADLEDTTQALIGVMAAYAGEGMTVSNAIGIMNATVGSGDMRLEKLAKGIATGILPAATQFGLTLTDVSAGLATLTDNVTPADQSATRLRMTFALLGAPSGAAAKELATIGLSSLQLSTDMRKPNGLLVALEDLKSHLEKSGLSAEEQSNVISRAFGGGRSSAAIETLLDELDRLKQKYTDITAGANSFGDAWASTQMNFNLQKDRMVAGLQVLAIEWGDRFLPITTSVMKFFADHTSDIGTWIDRTVDLASKMGDYLAPEITLAKNAAADLLRFLEQIWTQAAKTISFGPLLQALQQIQQLIGQAAAPKPPPAAGPSKVADIAGGRYETPAPPRPRVGGEPTHEMPSSPPRAAGQPSPSEAAQNLGQGIATAIGTSAGAIANALITVVQKAVDMIDWFELGKTAADVSFPFILGLLGGMFGPQTMKAFQQHWGEMLFIAVITGASIFLAPTKLIGPIAEVLGRIPFVGGILKFLVTALNQLGGPIRGVIGDLAKQAVDSFVAGWGERFVGWGGGRLLQFFRTVGDILKGRFGEQAIEWVDRFFTNFGRAVAESGPAQWYRAWVYVTRSVEESGGRLVSWIGKLAVEAWTLFKTEMLRLWEGIGGKDLPKFVDEFKTTLGEIATWARDIGQRAMDWLRQKITDGTSWILGHLGSFKDNAVQAFQSLVSGLESLAGRLGDALSGPFKAGLRGAVGVLNGFIKALDNIPGIGGAIEKVIGKGDINIPGLATGGVVDRPTLAVVGEGGAPEYIIPTDRQHGGRARDLWMQAGKAIGTVCDGCGSGVTGLGQGCLQCLEWADQVLGGMFSGLPAAKDLVPYINSTTPAPGELFVSTLGAFGHTGFVIGPNLVKDANWVACTIAEHALSDIPDIVGYISLGDKFGTLGSLAKALGGGGMNLSSMLGPLISGPLGAAESQARQLGGLGSAFALGTVDAVGNAVKTMNFDSGGWLLPGSTLAFNNTGMPERVTPPGGGQPTINVYVTNPAPQPHQIARELAWAMKVS